MSEIAAIPALIWLKSTAWVKEGHEIIVSDEEEIFSKVSWELRYKIQLLRFA